jgi:TolB-like protein/tRNA A-37 threonylcarbamoyl transferase component Bud32/Tfp pilus assembly protein PilF
VDRLTAALADRYRIERELGQGGMATVYLAEDLKHRRKVALKVLKPELGHALGADRFLREIETTANLRHPHILPLFDSGRVDDLLFYVMPYVEGETLRQRLKRETHLPIDDAIEIAGEVADALGYAHARGIVHRDIKPENILLESGHAVVADFGIARAVDAAGGEQLTETGVSIGTPTYMSPEQAGADAEPDARSDQYALGCVLFEMLAGQPPFTGASAGSVVRQHVAVEPPPVSALRPAVPAAVAATVKKALAKDPADRFGDLEGFRQALHGSEVGSGAVETGARASRLSAHRGRNVAVVAALVVVAAVTVVKLVRRGGNTQAAADASVAVLPFVDLSPDHADAYLGDGIAETLSNALSNVPGLSVAARTSTSSASDRRESPRDVGRELGVSTVLDGSVQRAGGRLRVIARLVRTADGVSLWSDSFDRDADSIFVLQDDVASAVAEAIRGQVLPRGAAAATGTRDLQAYDAYLQGRFFWKKRAVPDLVQAIGYFNEAIARDSTYARAWAGLADAWLMLPFYSDTILTAQVIPRARRAAERALSLDPGLAEAHTSLAYAHTVYDWDWEAAEREFRRAIELDPTYPTAHKWHSDLLSALGRLDDALAEAGRAAELDPRSPNPRTVLASREWYLGREKEAGADYDRALAMDPTFPLALRSASNFHWAMGDTARFFTLRERLDAVSGNATVPVATLRAALAAGGRDSVLRLQADAPGARHAPTERAKWHAQLGDLDAAFADLDQAVEERTVWLPVEIRYPNWSPLRADPRWAALLKRMGLEPMTEAGGGGS